MSGNFTTHQDGCDAKRIDRAIFGLEDNDLIIAIRYFYLGEEPVNPNNNVNRALEELRNVPSTRKNLEHFKQRILTGCSAYFDTDDDVQERKRQEEVISKEIKRCERILAGQDD